LATVYEVKNEADPWSTIPWLWFGISAAVSFAGVVLLRMKIGPDEKHEEKTAESLTALNDSIARLANSAALIAKKQDKLAPTEMVHEIDEYCADDFALFVEKRKSMISAYGLKDYANVMTQFSAGERAMNRAWSAAADGYVDEVRDCLERSHRHLKETHDLLSNLAAGEK
jgi:hypothetical protein